MYPQPINHGCRYSTLLYLPYLLGNPAYQKTPSLFFVYSYSHIALLGYGGALFIQVSRPLSVRGGTLQAPHCPPPRPVLSK